MSEPTISELVFELNINSIQQDRITNFFEAHGENGTVNILKKILKTQTHQKKNGLRQDTVMYLWTGYSQAYVKSAAGRTRAAEAAQQVANAKKAHEAAKAKGYKANRETITAQLDGLYDKGDISTHQYSLGMIGLDTVFGYVAQAKNLPNVKNPLKEVWGKWPGDESIDEILDTLKGGEANER